MRNLFALAVLAGFLGSRGPIFAQSYPIRANVIVPSVEVRSGPTDKFYVTSELHQGESVSVIRQAKEPGWLEVAPPAGSFTWINAKYVRKLDDYEAVVVDDDPKFVAPALVGSGTFKGKPTVEARPGFLAGTIVYIVNPPLAVDGETWLPVRPDLREVRYIPATAVNLPATATITASPSWAVGKAGSPQPGTAPGYPAAGDAKPVDANTTSYSAPKPPVAAIPGPLSATPPAAQTFETKWSSWGTLQSTSFTKDGQPMYLLVGQRGEPLMYATARTGTSLRSYVNRLVCLHGQMVYRPDPYITTPYMVASHVAVP